MHHSEYMSMANAAISHVKANVKYRGLNTAGGWIRNPTDVPQKWYARIQSNFRVSSYGFSLSFSKR